MANYEKEVFAVQNSDGNLIGIDRESGGYPWTPNTLTGVWLTDSKAGAEGFIKRMNHGNPGRYKLVRVKVIVVEEVK